MTVQSNDIMECSARLETSDGDDIVGAFQFRLESVGFLPDADAITAVIEFLEVIYTQIRLVIPILTVFRDITIRNQTQAINYGTFPWPTLANGVVGGNEVPPGVTILASFSTGISHVNLRKYFGNMPVALLDLPGLWNAASVGVVVGGVALMLVPFVATFGTWSYGYNSPKTLGWVVPNAAVVTDVPAYQRRRRQGRGS